ncbi:hypothetical protein HYS96_00140 [Candidatus Daviesbacteria bacterium]|nr:hypothetical protein [Candidatus Daviesbacteria bacterium]
MMISKKFLPLSLAIFFILFLFALFAFPKSSPAYAAAQCDPSFEKSCAGGCIGANDICCGSGYCTLGNQCATINGRAGCIPTGSSVCGNGYCEQGLNCVSTTAGYRCVEPGRQQCGSGNYFCYAGNTCVNASIPLCCGSGQVQCGTGCVPSGVSCCNLPGTSYYCPTPGDVCTNTNNTVAGLSCIPPGWTSCGGGYACPLNTSCSGSGNTATCYGSLVFPVPGNGEMLDQRQVVFDAVFAESADSRATGQTFTPAVTGYLKRIVFAVWDISGNPSGLGIQIVKIQGSSWIGTAEVISREIVKNVSQYSFVQAEFAEGERPFLQAGGYYAVVIRSTGGSGYYNLAMYGPHASSQGYTRGDLCGFNLSGSTPTQIAPSSCYVGEYFQVRDLAFSTYMLPSRETDLGVAPPPALDPWIQTTGGDVHSNTGINTPGGP